MIYERLILMRDLLHKDGSIYVHLEPDVGNLIRLILDEILDVMRCVRRSHGSELRRTAT